MELSLESDNKENRWGDTWAEPEPDGRYIYKWGGEKSGQYRNKNTSRKQEFMATAEPLG